MSKFEAGREVWLTGISARSGDFSVRRGKIAHVDKLDGFTMYYIEGRPDSRLFSGDLFESRDEAVKQEAEEAIAAMNQHRGRIKALQALIDEARSSMEAIRASAKWLEGEGYSLPEVPSTSISPLETECGSHVKGGIFSHPVVSVDGEEV